ncbi:MAG: NAD(P)H-dependent glycerol-3-phosphate dehydrogenase [Acidimicrobiia bacterium]|nr:NAD(P)H-dependent glycerol-3-phosphate dehydrogenase [Acidimicrobiia bacterium]
MTMRVVVLGGGSWGTTVAHLAAHNTDTVLWCRDPEVAEAVTDRDENIRYLEGFTLHPNLVATTDMEAAVSGADLLVVGVPSHAFRSTLEAVAPSLRPWVPIVSLTKGLEQTTLLRMSEVATEVIPGHPAGALTGPNLAKEILGGSAAASVIAMTDSEIAQRLQAVFTTDLFRVYTNSDVAGCELGGALKNVIAVASGMADGLGTGDNTRAAVITRGLAELSRLGVAMGGEPATFAGLAGMGDLVATCISSQSRNRYVGEQLGRGRTLGDIIDEMNQVAEGVKTAKVVTELGRRHGVDMPISEEVHGVIIGDRTAGEAYRGLMSRRITSESAPPT